MSHPPQPAGKTQHQAQVVRPGSHPGRHLGAAAAPAPHRIKPTWAHSLPHHSGEGTAELMAVGMLNPVEEEAENQVNRVGLPLPKALPRGLNLPVLPRKGIRLASVHGEVAQWKQVWRRQVLGNLLGGGL